MIQKVGLQDQGLDTAEFVVCEYCGQRLNTKYYFCPACSKPYKNVESTLPAQIIFQPSLETLIHERKPVIMNIFWCLLGCLLIPGILGLFINANMDTPQGASKYVLVFWVAMTMVTACSLIFSIYYRRLIKPQFFISNINLKPLLLGILILAPLLAMNWGYFNILRSLLPDQNTTNIKEIFLNNGFANWMLILILCVWPGIFEELLFRGIMQTSLLQITNARNAIIVSSALFAAIHFSVLSAPYLFFVGVLLGWSHYRSRCLYVPMILHALHNYVVVAFFWS